MKKNIITSIILVIVGVVFVTFAYYSPLQKIPGYFDKAIKFVFPISDTNNSLSSAITSTPPPSRSFYMGFQPFPREASTQAVADAYNLVAQHSDIISIHFENCVPWQEAYKTSDLDQFQNLGLINNDVPFSLSHINSKLKVYLELMPDDRYTGISPSCIKPNASINIKNAPNTQVGNSNLSLDWSKLRLDDPRVITAYKNYIRYMVNKFHPAYVNYGIEATMLSFFQPKEFEAYKVLAKEVYTSMKSEYPNIPFMVSLTAGPSTFDKFKYGMISLLPYSDYVNISAYPFLEPGLDDPHNIPADIFTKVMALAPGKPFSIAETAYTAEPVSASFIIPGTSQLQTQTSRGSEEWQAYYTQFLLDQAKKLNAKFVIWVFPTDYDQLWNWLSQQPPPLNSESNKMWKDIGLFSDDHGPFGDSKNNRPALAIWDKVYNPASASTTAFSVSTSLISSGTSLSLSNTTTMGKAYFRVTPPAGSSQTSVILNSSTTYGTGGSSYKWLILSPHPTVYVLNIGNGSNILNIQNIGVSLATMSLMPNGTYTATITYTPTTAGISPKTINVTLTVNNVTPPPPAPCSLTITTPSKLPDATRGQPYYMQFQTSCGSGNYIWVMSTPVQFGSIGLTWSGLISGSISGTPSQTGTWTFTVMVYDFTARQFSPAREFTLTIK